MIYWIGDLNYRITDLEVDEVKENIRLNKLEDLYQADQLRNEIYKLDSSLFISGWFVCDDPRFRASVALRL